MSDGYDPSKSKVSNDTMERWRNTPVEQDGPLSQIPGLGPAGIKMLMNPKDEGDVKITNSYQLFGQYLLLKGPDTNEEKCSVELTNQKFWYWLKARGIVAHRSAIVLSIYEKVSTFFPGFFSSDEQENLSDDENAA